MQLRKVIAENLEEIILVLLLVLNLFEFFTKLSPELDYIDNIVDLTAMGYLVFKLSITRLFFGRRQSYLDMIIVLAFFLLFSKTIIGYSEVARSEMLEYQLPEIIEFSSATKPEKGSVVMEIQVSNIDMMLSTEIGLQRYKSIHTNIFNRKPTYLNATDSNGRTKLIRAHTIERVESFSDARVYFRASILNLFTRINFQQRTIEYVLFLAGASLLLFVAVFLAFTTDVQKPSLMHAIQEEGPIPASILDRMLRALIILIALNFFFVVVFNYGMEWFALVVDAPIVVILLFVYILLWMKHSRNLPVESIIYKLGDAGEKLYGRLVSLFHTKRGIMLGLSGMLVLHLITDVGVFIIPYSFFTQGTYDPLYFGHLGMDRSPLFSIWDFGAEHKAGLLFTDIAGAESKLAVVYVYAMNIIAGMLLLAIPMAIWYLIFLEHDVRVPVMMLSLFLASAAAFLLSPLFRIGRITSSSIVGVDITTQSIAQAARLSPQNIMLISAIVGIIALLLCIWFKRQVIVASIFLSLVYFVIYIYFYFADVSTYFMQATASSISSKHFFAAAYFLVFLTTILIFYIGGFLLFMYEIVDAHGKGRLY